MRILREFAGFFGLCARGVLLLAVAGNAWTGPLSAADAEPLVNAHAHNDYAHPRPLHDALEHGFCGVEADIHLVDGKLLVAHGWWELNSERTLEKLYLDPLRLRVKDRGGKVHRNGPPLLLLVDIKTDAAPTYAALDKVLTQYADLLSVKRDGKFQEKAVTAVISGNCPREVIEKQTVRYAAIDGRTRDLKSDAPADLIPLISDAWSTQFQWRGEGEMPADERRKLAEFVAQAHAKGRRVRFWGTPEKTEVWRTQRTAGVDLLNTDKLAMLRDFLRTTPPQGK